MAIERKRSFDSSEQVSQVRVDRTIDAREDDPINLWPIIDTAWEFKWVVLLVTALCPAAVLLANLLLPKTYQAAATVSVAIPVFRNELTRLQFGMQAHQQFAQSDHVRNQVAARLASQRDMVRRYGLGDWNAVLYETHESSRPLLPTLGLVVRTTDPGWSQHVANAWAHILVNEPTPLNTIDDESVKFILSEHPKAKAVLLRAERSLQSLRDVHARATLRLRLEDNAGALAADLDAKRALVHSIDEELVRLGGTLAETRSRIEQLTVELKGTSQPGGLAADLARERSNVNGLQARDRALRDQLIRVRGEANALREQLIQAEAAENALFRQHTVEAAPLELEVEEAQATFAGLDAKLAAAKIATLQPRPSVHLRSLAALPETPIDRNVLRNTALAVPAGLVASALIVGVLLQLRQRPRHGRPRPV